MSIDPHSRDGRTDTGCYPVDDRRPSVWYPMYWRQIQSAMSFDGRRVSM